jgi:hypothetical protein
MKDPVKEWNKSHKVGTQVSYAAPDGKVHITKTVSKAWFLGGTLPVIQIESEPVCVSMENIKADIPSNHCII